MSMLWISIIAQWNQIAQEIIVYLWLQHSSIVEHIRMSNQWLLDCRFDFRAHWNYNGVCIFSIHQWHSPDSRGRRISIKCSSSVMRMQGTPSKHFERCLFPFNIIVVAFMYLISRFIVVIIISVVLIQKTKVAIDSTSNSNWNLAIQLFPRIRLRIFSIPKAHSTATLDRKSVV